jgi:ligand-binding sensor domain-containing protein
MGASKWYATALAWAFVCAPSHAFALDPAKAITQYSLDTWTTADGLPQGSVQTIAQTADGYLWLGTRAGAARFNGVAFTALSPAEGMETIDVRSLRATADGALWLGTDGKGVWRYHPGAFESIPALESDSGNGIYQDDAGVTWVATWAGLVRSDAGSASRVTTREGLPSQSVFAVTGERGGVIWAATAGGLAEVRSGRVVRTWTDLTGQPRCLLVDRHGVLWAGTSGGLDRLRSGVVTHFTQKDGLLANYVNALVEDQGGSLWIGTEGGLNRYRDGRFDGYTVADGLPGSSVVSLMEDREGSLWIGLLGNGLVRLRDGSMATYGERDGLPDDHTTCVVQGHDGAVWIGTSRGLARYADGSFRVYGARDGLLNESILALAELRDGSIVIATHAPKLNRIRDGRVSVVETLTIPSSVADFIMEDPAGALWVGTRGIGLFHLRGRRVDHYPVATASGTNVIHAGIADAKGVLWFATTNGLLRYEKGAFTRAEVYRRPDGSMGVTFAIHADSDGTLWLGTRDRGVCRFHDGRTVRCYGRAEGLHENSVYQVLDGGDGRLWMSGPRGVFSVARKDLDALDAGKATRITPDVYGIAEGMKSTQGESRTWPAGIRSRDGRLWFPTANGIATIDPQRPKARRLVPPVVLEGVRVDGAPLGAGGTAPPGRGVVDVSWAVLTYVAPRGVRSRYRLEGFDPDWVDAGSDRDAHYTNLPPGEYRFRVIASYDDVANDEGATFSIHLAPHFYQTGWWRALLVVSAFAAAWGLYRARTYQLRARQAELSTKIAEALASVRTLRGLLPMCAWCRKVRSDQGYWEQIEAYVTTHTEVDFTHGICPECAAGMKRRPKASAGSDGPTDPAAG